MTASVQHIAMVWEEAPPKQWPDHYTGVCVKVCDGRAYQSAQRFSWSDNYAAWVERFGQERVGAWAVAYPQDGQALGEVIAKVAPHTGYVVLDVEDFGGIRWSPQSITAICEGVKHHYPHAPVGYSTYPTRAQAAEHHIDQATLDRLCDFSAPQVYFPYQRDAIATIDRDNRHASWIVAPGDDPHWDASVKASLVRSGRVFYWRAGLSGWEGWPAKTAAAIPVTPEPAPAPDPLRPTHEPLKLPPLFVAWDGKGWWLTDLFRRRALTEAQVQTLVKGGVVVVRWGAVTDIAVEVGPA